jgi:hypothetical protein
MTPRRRLDRRKSGSLSVASVGSFDALGGGEGMENLADELADAWDEDAGDGAGSSFLEGLREGSLEPSLLPDEMCNGGDFDHGGAYSVRSPPTPSRRPVLDEALYSPTRLAGNVKRDTSKRHKRGESQYDGSDRGAVFDREEAEGILPALAQQMGNIEALASRGLGDDTVSEAGGVIPRTTTALKDLGAQASIENGATRIITAYTSIASHRTHEIREVFSLAHSLLLDRYPTLSEEEIDSLTYELDLLIRYLQLPSGPSPLQSLQSLVANTTDLAHSLRSLSDILQESRQAASAASRRLKNARDFVMELQYEEEAREEGIRYLEKGDWDRRIRQREAQRVCGDVVAGFETTCNVWRDRLFGTISAEATPA